MSDLMIFAKSVIATSGSLGKAVATWSTTHLGQKNHV